MRAFKAAFTLLILCFSLFILSTSDSLSVEDTLEEYWMGIYSGDRRIGYSYNSIKTLKGITEVKELTKLKIDLLGKENEVETQASYKLEGYKILSFNFEMKSGSMDLKARGVREGDILKITMDTVSGTTERSLSLQKELILPSLLPKWLIENKFSIGDSFEISLFEPLSVLMGMDSPISTHRIEGKELVDIPSGRFDTHKIYSNFMGTQSTSWMTAEGEIVKQEFPPGLIAIKESKEDILSKKNSSFDIVEKTSIPTNVKLDNARKLKYLKIKLGGIDTAQGFDIEDGYRQYLDGQILQIKSKDYNPKKSPYTLPYNAPEYLELLKAEFLIQSDDKEIVSITNKILDGETDPRNAASKINKWIYKNLKKSATVSLPNAKDVLKTKVGDCNEHAVLFSAMSRAAGIPTKTVLGAMYYEGRFYYHAWNEVYIGQWVAVDSTYGQLPADATHIKLIEGDMAKSGEILKVVGKINIEIIDAT
ncbi:MAG: transglutaminase-like domain-containing protein [Candidatus Dadabacteria bacterium]|nr:transglutaminase-like domain-containing protein [Candidatus Dadabacteria bacterium]